MTNLYCFSSAAQIIFKNSSIFWKNGKETTEDILMIIAPLYCSNIHRTMFRRIFERDRGTAGILKEVAQKIVEIGFFEYIDSVAVQLKKKNRNDHYFILNSALADLFIQLDEAPNVPLKIKENLKKERQKKRVDDAYFLLSLLVYYSLAVTSKKHAKWIVFHTKKREEATSFNKMLTPPPARAVSNFIGRDTIINMAFDELIYKKRNVALSGISGIGKSQLAKKIWELLQTEDLFEHMAWINFDSTLVTSMTNSFIDIDISKNHDEKLQLLRRYLREMKDTLFIAIDNFSFDAKNLAFLQELVSYNCSILLTTKEQVDYDYFTDIPIPSLSKKFSYDLFVHHYGEALSIKQEKTVKAILTEIGCHTLMIELLAKTIHKTAMDFHDVLKSLKTGLISFSLPPSINAAHEKLLSRETLQVHMTTLFSILTPDFSPEEKELLEYMSIFPGLPFSRELIERMFHSDPGALYELIEKRWIKEEVIIQPTGLTQHFYTLLETPALTIRNQLNLTTVLNKLANFFQQLTYSKEKISHLESRDIVYYLERFVISFTSYFKDIRSVVFLEKLSFYISELIGNHPLAAQYLEQAIAIYHSDFHHEELFIGGLFHRLGTLYYRMGKVESADKYLQEAFHIRQLETAKTMHNLGAVNLAKSNLQIAENYYAQSLAIKVEILGDHVLTAKSYQDLALIFAKQERFPLAKEYYEIALNILTNLPEKDSSILAVVYSNLSDIYFLEGDFETTEELLLKSLSEKEEVLTENHPTIANCYMDLGSVYQENKRPEKASFYYEKAYLIYLESFGEEHERTLRALNLAQKNLQ